jgi:hypothetical protein
MWANEQTWLRAGKDIRNVTLDLRNLHRTDTTWLEAGNDIINADLSVEGPGSVLLTAGRDVYNPRTVSIGNRRFDSNNRPITGTDIRGLPADRASIDVIAGLNGTNANAVTRAIERADMSGSGIGTVEAFTGVQPGEVDLIAPVGTVNFGDAGVRVSGNFNVAARFVVNIDNLAVKGEVKGVPKDDVKIAPLTLDTKDKAAADAVKDATQQMPSDRPSVIIVEFLGYGGGDGEPRQDDDKRPRWTPERSGRSPAYDPGNPVQFVGIGKLTADQAQKLTPNERRALEAQ